ncbi:MAG TPA: NAD(P)-dependent alcohol dehydrogenase [Thermoanaerobaculaceae bacterium]|nr:NAD(P)-dependent alcohol dehydrogenase [Thermoanaerobaculaceae bacterium]HPS77434.1 NAD(P)-dependent alcohol dehydrogenase [Thermoanaerobaculaceae bacterium]
MLKTNSYAAHTAGSPLAPYSFERREPGPEDVLIDILYCGVCHSDIHQARDEWGGSIFPMVPGHEIVGRVAAVGDKVTRFKVGDIAGVGCMVDSCRTCHPCHDDHEQFCEKGAAWTYNGTEMDRHTPTFGGYSTRIVVAERFTLKVPAGLDLAAAAPLLCAGITTYSPLRQWQCSPGNRVGVVGLGGLGHMAVKLAASMGAEVTVLSTSAAKGADALRLGAHAFESTRDQATFKKLAGRLDLIIDTISAPHDYNAYLGLLRVRGAMVLLGVPPQPTPVAAFMLISGNRRLAGSLIGGIAETQEMLDHCAKHGIVSDIEVIPIQKINEAYDRMMKGDVRYRFVIDIASLAG